jgi:hypothetical protein
MRVDALAIRTATYPPRLNGDRDMNGRDARRALGETRQRAASRARSGGSRTRPRKFQRKVIEFTLREAASCLLF